MNNGGSLLLALFLLVLGLWIYFLPSIVAKSRDHRNLKAVFALNLLLGWTLLGWVAALVWAYVRPPVSVSAPQEVGYGTSAMRICPFCAEQVRREAIKCKHCGSALPAIEPTRPTVYSDQGIRTWSELPPGK